MSYIYKILDHDLHKSKINSENIRIFFNETPGRQEFLPCVVSTIDKGRFIINRSITKENRIRSGVFVSSEETIDDVIPSLFNEALRLSVSSNMRNVFRDTKLAFDYIKDASGLNKAPNYCLAPSTMTDDQLKDKLSGLKYDGEQLNGYCKVIRFNVDAFTFLSRPDFVGLYTRYPNNQNSVILHNVEMGVSFSVF